MFHIICKVQYMRYIQVVFSIYLSETGLKLQHVVQYHECKDKSTGVFEVQLISAFQLFIVAQTHR